MPPKKKKTKNPTIKGLMAENAKLKRQLAAKGAKPKTKRGKKNGKAKETTKKKTPGKWPTATERRDTFVRIVRGKKRKQTWEIMGPELHMSVRAAQTLHSTGIKKVTAHFAKKGIQGDLCDIIEEHELPVALFENKKTGNWGGERENPNRRISQARRKQVDDLHELWESKDTGTRNKGEELVLEYLTKMHSLVDDADTDLSKALKIKYIAQKVGVCEATVKNRSLHHYMNDLRLKKIKAFEEELELAKKKRAKDWADLQKKKDSLVAELTFPIPTNHPCNLKRLPARENCASCGKIPKAGGGQGVRNVTNCSCLGCGGKHPIKLHEGCAETEADALFAKTKMGLPDHTRYKDRPKKAKAKKEGDENAEDPEDNKTDNHNKADNDKANDDKANEEKANDLMDEEADEEKAKDLMDEEKAKDLMDEKADEGKAKGLMDADVKDEDANEEGNKKKTKIILPQGRPQLPVLLETPGVAKCFKEFLEKYGSKAKHPERYVVHHYLSGKQDGMTILPFVWACTSCRKCWCLIECMILLGRPTADGVSIADIVVPYIGTEDLMKLAAIACPKRVQTWDFAKASTLSLKKAMKPSGDIIFENDHLCGPFWQAAENFLRGGPAVSVAIARVSPRLTDARTMHAINGYKRRTDDLLRGISTRDPRTLAQWLETTLNHKFMQGQVDWLQATQAVEDRIGETKSWPNYTAPPGGEAADAGFPGAVPAAAEGRRNGRKAQSRSDVEFTASVADECITVLQKCEEQYFLE